MVSPKPEVPGPSHDVGVASQILATEGEVPKSKPLDQGGIQHDQLMVEVNLEEVVEVIVSNGDNMDLTLEGPQAASTPASEPAHHRK